MNTKCTCLDDTARPNEIPISQWVKKGVEYTIIKLSYLNMHNRILGVKLEELNIDNCAPYAYFRLTRFGFTKEDLEKLLGVKVNDDDIKEEDLEEQLIEI